MKILAIENKLRPLMLGEEALLGDQAKAIYALYVHGYITQMHQKENSSEAILVLDCISKREAENYLAKLPLVRAGQSTFDVYPLEPFKGFREFMV
jgi:hypothetical protein